MVGDGPPTITSCKECSGNIYIDKVTGEHYVLRNQLWTTKVHEYDFSYDEGLFENTLDILLENKSYLQASHKPAELVSKNFFVGSQNFFFEFFLGEINTSQIEFNLGSHTGETITKFVYEPSKAHGLILCENNKTQLKLPQLHHMAFSRDNHGYNIIINNKAMHECKVNNIESHIVFVAVTLVDGYLEIKKVAFAKGV